MTTRRAFMKSLVALPASLSLTGTRAAPANSRVALVIGNDQYPSAPLNNAVSDASAVGDALTRLGFSVISVENGTRSEIQAGIESLRRSLKGERSAVLLYYAGHGVQLEWKNYLVPVDARLERAPDVLSQAIPLDAILQSFADARAATKIVVLDACRDNPFSQGSTGKGLAQMDAPSQTFLAYATAPGCVAEDGLSAHGLYTDALLRELTRPGVKIEDMFKRVRLQVRLDSAGRQIPWESTSLESDFYFAPPSGELDQVTMADEKRLELEIAEWHRAEASNTTNAWGAYLSRFPSGYFASAAQFHLDHLQAPSAIIHPSPRSLNALPTDSLPPGNNRFRVGDEFVWRAVDGYTQVVTPQRYHVVEADDLKVTFSNGVQTDQAGNWIRDSGGQYDPIGIVFPPELAVGTKWHTGYRYTRNDATSYQYYDRRVAAREMLTIPAGRFDAFRVEAEGYTLYGMMRQSYWIDARSLNIIKWQRHDTRGGQWFEKELVSASFLAASAEVGSAS